MAEVSHGDYELLQAAETGNYSEAVTAIKKFKADVNTIQPVSGSTPLHLAVQCGNLLLVRLLLIEHRARYDLEDKKKRTALSIALELGHPKLIDLFVERGAVKPPEVLPADALVNATLDKDAEKVRAILTKVRSGAARIDINYRKEKELRTALHVAAAAGQRAICELLLQAEMKDRDGQTPLFSAVQFKRVALIELLLSKGAAVDVRNKHGYTALHRACRDGQVDTISAFFAKSAVLPAQVNLREMQSATGQTPLFSAARSYRSAAVKLLLKDFKVNPAAQDQAGDTALHYICADTVSEERRSPRLETLRAMLECGCPLNSVNNDGQTPIFKALLAPARELVECLVQAGANLRVQDKDGNTPLHIAVSSQAAEAEALVSILLKENLDVNTQNAAAATPMDLASTESIRAMLRGYTPPPPPAAAAPVLKPMPKKAAAPIPGPKRKGSENDIIVDGEDSDNEAEEGEVRKPLHGSGQFDKRPRREHSWQKQGSSKSAMSATSESTSSKGSFSTPPPTPLVRLTPSPAAVVAVTKSPLPIVPPAAAAAAPILMDATEVKGDAYIGFEPHDTQPPPILPSSSKSSLSSSSSAAAAAPSPSPKLSNSANSPYVNLRDDVPIDPQRAASLGPVIEHTELKLADVIGEGAFGAVRKGEWNLMPVAVKILHKSDPKATQMFYKEVELFNKIRHKHIARYLGSCIRPPLCMVMEYYPESLMNRIAGRPLDVPTLLHISHGVALALLHLHSRKIIHRDIKPSNILLDEHLNPYVADFGVSREYGQPGTMTGIGTPLYMAPEMLTTKKYSEKVDQYAFAMLLWQMLTGKSVAKGYHDNGDEDEDIAPLQIAFRAATQGWRPPLPATAPPELRQLIQACWDHSPDARPGFDKIASTLQALTAQFPRK